MILVDTSVWLEHFRKGIPELAQALDHVSVLTHPLVITELACGNMKNRQAILSYMDEMPSALSATPVEVRTLIENRRLWGSGIGCIDAHMVASALLSNCTLWTLDRRLQETAESAGVRIHKITR